MANYFTSISWLYRRDCLDVHWAADGDLPEEVQRNSYKRKRHGCGFLTKTRRPRAQHKLSSIFCRNPKNWLGIAYSLHLLSKNSLIFQQQHYHRSNHTASYTDVKTMFCLVQVMQQTNKKLGQNLSREGLITWLTYKLFKSCRRP
jgi:hypothetical protein